MADPEKVFYLTCFSNEKSHQEEVWFVNYSDETLDYVRPASGGFATCDDDVVPMNQSPDSVFYTDVQPKEAVMIDIYDAIFDGDFMISWGVDLKSESLGEKYFGSDPIKGKTPNITLHWRPLPEELKDAGNPEALVDPRGVAEAYRKRFGKSLPTTIHFNKGNLLYGVNTDFLNACGLRLTKESLRDGKAVNYRFLNDEGGEIFRTLDLDRAINFIHGLEGS